MKRFIPATLVTLTALSSTEAQEPCRPGKDSNEAKMLAFFAAPVAYSPAGNVGWLRAGDVRLSFDATYVPSPGDDISRSEICNDKGENTELSPVFPRPRLALGLGRGLALEVSWLPPVTVMDATPNLFSVGLSYLVPFGDRGMSFTARGHATAGTVKGPITCADDVIQDDDPFEVCYATRPSEDTYKPNMFGLEGVLGFGGQSRVSTYLGLGYTFLRPRFQVGFVDVNGNVDNTRIEVDLQRVAAFAGGIWHLSDRVGLTAELYSVPEDVTTVRIGGSWALRTARP